MVPVIGRILQGLALLGLLFVGACASIPRSVIGVDGDDISARDVPGTQIRPIFVATTRAPASDEAVFYSSERGSLSFARVDVSVPPLHQTGKVERAQTLPPDPRKHFVALDPHRFAGENDFLSALNATLAKQPPGRRNALIFVHGFNTAFDGALFRIAQFAHDIDYPGVVVLFTWPSRGDATEYLYDLSSALTARDDLVHTFSLLSKSNADSGDIVAHSMGNILTVEALRQGVLEGTIGLDEKVNHIVLASPDIDIDLFEKQIGKLPVDAYDFYVIISRDDKALALSKFLYGGVARVGAAEIEAFDRLGLTVVDLTEIDDGDSSHTKFAGSPAIVKAIRADLREGFSAATQETAPPGVRIIERVVRRASQIRQ